MGLDMYMYKFTKISKSFRNEFRSTISYERYLHLKDNSNIRFYSSEDSYLFDYISNKSKQKFFVPVKVNMSYVNIRKMLEDKYGKDVPQELEIAQESYGSDGVECVYCTPDYKQRYELTFTKESQKPYVFNEDTEEVAVEMSEVAYWRKNYLLDTYIQESILHVEPRDSDKLNCCYIELTRDNLQNIVSAMERLLHGDDLDHGIKLPDKSDREYEYLSSQVSYAISQVSGIIKNTDFNNEMITYHPWW